MHKEGFISMYIR